MIRPFPLSIEGGQNSDKHYRLDVVNSDPSIIHKQWKAIIEKNLANRQDMGQAETIRVEGSENCLTTNDDCLTKSDDCLTKSGNYLTKSVTAYALLSKTAAIRNSLAANVSPPTAGSNDHRTNSTR